MKKIKNDKEILNFLNGCTETYNQLFKYNTILIEKNNNESLSNLIKINKSMLYFFNTMFSEKQDFFKKKKFIVVEEIEESFLKDIKRLLETFSLIDLTNNELIENLNKQFQIEIV